MVSNNDLFAVMLLWEKKNLYQKKNVSMKFNINEYDCMGLNEPCAYMTIFMSVTPIAISP